MTSSAAARGSKSTSAPKSAKSANLPLRQRPVDIFFICIFSIFIITCIISDSVEGLGIPQTLRSTNLLAQWNYFYASHYDPLYKAEHVWLRFISGTSAFLYLPFYVLLIISLVKGWNRIQLFAVIYATMIISLTVIPIFGDEFFGPAADRTPQPLIFLAYNGPYVVIPFILLLRMRKPLPFRRRF
ncbi:MAG TPA: emopamil-binding family protein [Galbitalea sp.]|nr:emopamil-binding family protein [Galbitalea sp.]